MPSTNNVNDIRHSSIAASHFASRLTRGLCVFGFLIYWFFAAQTVLASQRANIESTHTTQSDAYFDHTHYLIPGFSDHLIAINYIVYRDLQVAKRAANRHDTLRLRIALADANGHLLQMATPPALSGLRDQIVMVSEKLHHGPGSLQAATWRRLLSNIQHLPMPSADKSARARLEATARRAQNLTQSGHLGAARAQILSLVSEIEITVHVFPINHLRNDIQTAIDAASYDKPNWVKAGQAIERAMMKTQWLLHPDGRNLIQAYDSAVAAYTEWPESGASRASLRQAYWYLGHTREARSLMSQFLAASRNPDLDLPTIAHLQHTLALYIHHSRDPASSAN